MSDTTGWSRPPLAAALALLLLGGCATVGEFWDKEILGVYSPETLRERERTVYVDSLNYYLGRPKADRVRIAGPPDRCTTPKAGEEVCEWARGPGSAEHAVTFTYAGGVAASWSYRGTFGEFTSATVAAGRSGTASPRSAAGAAREPQWTNPAKPESDFQRDSLECQDEVRRDPRAVSDAGNRLLVQQAVERCLKARGWTQR